MRRKIPVILCAGAAVVALAVAALPWWLGGALRHVGGSRGLTFARYERLGYTRFALHDIEVRVAGVRVAVSRIEADTPLVAWWRRGEVIAGNWSVEVAPRPTDSAPRATDGGWVPLRGRLQRVAAQIQRWAPRAMAGSGVVRWPGAELTCESAVWTQSALETKGLAYRALKGDAKAEFHRDDIRLAWRGPDLVAKLVSRGGEVTGDLTLWGQRAALNAHFAERGWLPAEATVQADDWRVPGEKLKLGDAYAAVRGRGKVAWTGEKFSAELAATGEPVNGKSAPPLDVAVRGQGDAAAFTVEALSATLPGITARLSEPVTVERSGQFRASGARFTVEADLAKQPWFAATGVVSGEARWVASAASAPMVEFQLAARDVAAADFGAARAEAKGRLDWPRVRVTEGTLAGTAGEQLAWRGGWDFATKEVLDAAAEGTIRRVTVARWVPAGVEFETVEVNAEAAGALRELKHAGWARAENVKLRALNPLGLALRWAGRGAAVETLAVEATAGATALVAEGAVVADSARLTKLELAHGGVVRLALTEPATLQWRPVWRVESLRLAGPDGARVHGAVAWGEAGRMELAVTNFSSTWLDALGVRGGPAWRLDNVAASGTWERGPLVFSLAGAATVDLTEGKSASVAIRARGDHAGVMLEELSVMEAGRSVVKATGKIPLRISPAAGRIVQIDDDGALGLDVTTAANAGFWQELPALTGFELKEPEAVAQVTGTWARPQGTVRVKAARMAADAARFKRPMPTLEGLDVALTGDASEVRLEKLAVNIEGQAVRANGRLPIADGKWREWFAQPLAWVQRGAEGRLEVPDAEVAALARFFPVFVAPKGRLQLDVSYRAGELGGSVRIHDAATRPLGPLGVLQEISADIALAGRSLELRSVTAHSGGQTVTLSGKVALPEAVETHASVADGLKYDVLLKGENLPFVRQTGVLMRGDVDLKLTSPARGAPTVAGTVRLRESLFLSDARALLPGGARTKARTPPYFAVEAPPYDAWQLDVAVEGESFLKLRTALFTGVASAKFRLGGTLSDPLLRGEVTLDEGAVKLPFATFAVQEGRVTLGPEHDHEPQVWFVGAVRRLNYDLRMEASGPASAPRLVFSSNPPLESGQVLLLVMAGEAPHDEITYTDRQRMARLGTFLGQSLLASFGGDSEASERLSITTGESVSRRGRETYGIEYRLSDRWSLTGEYDEFDDFNAGVKWRIFSKGGSREPGKK